MFSRRHFIAATALLPNLMSAGDWSKKKLDDLSQKDVEALLNRSPWSKEIKLTFDTPAMGGGRGPGGGMGGGMPGGGGMGGGMPGGGMGGGMPGGGMPGGGPPGGAMPGGGPGAMPELKALVRWESALPVRTVRKTEAGEYYVVSFSNMPLMSAPPQAGRTKNGRTQAAAPDIGAMLQAASRLERKGKDPIPAVKVDSVQSEGGAVYQVSFSKADPIQLPDKEVTVVSSLGPLGVKVKFNLKDMVYNGQLEL